MSNLEARPDRHADEHPNATAYRRAGEAMRAGDFAAIRNAFTEDVVWHLPGRHPFAGDILGRDAVLEFLGRLPALGFWLTEHDVFANDVHVCARSAPWEPDAGTTTSRRGW
jgi:uncharacterized protein